MSDKNIDKDIEILKELKKELNKDVYMEKNNLIRKEKWREKAQAIENVLSELETYNKIAEFLACEYWNIDGNFDGTFSDWKEVLEWAKSEVLKNE